MENELVENKENLPPCAGMKVFKFVGKNQRFELTDREKVRVLREKIQERRESWMEKSRVITEMLTTPEEFKNREREGKGSCRGKRGTE